eukprot:2236516-Amphidinium_carterae.1
MLMVLVVQEWFECNDEQQSGHHWKVVGGVEAGGILVREGRCESQPIPFRTEINTNTDTGARREISAQMSVMIFITSSSSVAQVDGVRLEYELVSGRGPTSGWVSMKARGKDLLVALDLVALGLSG